MTGYGKDEHLEGECPDCGGTGEKRVKSGSTTSRWGTMRITHKTVECDTCEGTGDHPDLLEA